VAVILLGAAVAIYGRWQVLQGPLTLGDGSSKTGIAIDAGQTATYGGLVAENIGKRAVTVDDIDFVVAGKPNVARVVDVRIVDVSKVSGRLVGADVKYSPPAQAISPVGAAIPSSVGDRRGYQLLFGIKALGPGIATFKRVRIDYHIGIVRYRLTVDHEAKICVPSTVRRLSLSRGSH
jgi:hypothetical protein